MRMPTFIQIVETPPVRVMLGMNWRAPATTK